MAIYRSSRAGDEPPKHQPEFIYIDERQERAKRAESLQKASGAYIEKLQLIDNRKIPFIFRFLSLLWSFAFAAGAALLFVLCVVLFPIAILLFFRWERLNAFIKRQWTLMGKLLVFSIGTLIATVNPPYGFGIIVLYFVLRGEDIENNALMRLIKPVK